MTTEALERPSVRVTFRALALGMFGAALLAWAAGRYIYERYGGYRPLALVHVPAAMRYRARIELSDPKRVPALAPLLTALDPRGQRRAALEARLGTTLGREVRELAFGAGPGPGDFVLVFGMASRTAGHADAACAVLAGDGIRSERIASGGCRLPSGTIIRQSDDGSVVVSSREALVADLLGTPDIGDRMGFSGPSVRGAAPELDELGREARQLATRVGAEFP